MSVQGPGKPPGATGPVFGGEVPGPSLSPPHVTRTERAFSVDMEKAAPATGPADAAPPSSVRPTPAVALAGAIDRIAADVRAGRLPQADAIHRVVESTLDALLPAAAPPATREQVREALAAKLDIDPTLRARLVGLGLAAPGTTENP